MTALTSDLRQQFPGTELRGVTVDIRADGAVESLVASALAEFGKLDAVVDCLVTGPAEGKLAGSFAATTPAAYAEFAEYSIVYLERLTHAVLPALKVQGGTLITLISDAGVFAAPRQTLIGAMRAAAIGFIRNLAVEVARDGVRAHCISPSFIDESDVALRLQAASPDRLEKARARAGLGLPTPRDIAPLVMFLVGEGAKRITGQVISINGGLNA